ncbi:MAG TPA: SAM-dependent methyltransferase, partial [Acholeplasmataceae bacterium]|nr:SAM-dependent methyltransferase [Acholeplasmataceae bacterium]
MLVKIKENALKNNIPIIQDEALAFIIDKIKINNIKTILEIGTAVGYSAISFAVNDILIDTIERENDLYEKAIDNIAIMNLEDKINIIYADALKYETDKKYDLIFID